MSTISAREPIETLAALVRGFQYPNAHKAALAAAARNAAPVRGPAARAHSRIVSYSNDVFEALFDDEGRFFFEADCFRAPEAHLQPFTDSSISSSSSARKPLRRPRKQLIKKRRSTTDDCDPFGLAGTHASLGWSEKPAFAESESATSSSPAQEQQDRRVVSLSRQESRDSVLSAVPSLTASDATDESEDEALELADDGAEDKAVVIQLDAVLPAFASPFSCSAKPSPLTPTRTIAPAAPAKRLLRRSTGKSKPLAFFPRSAPVLPAFAAFSTPTPAVTSAPAASNAWDVLSLPHMLRRLLSANLPTLTPAISPSKASASARPRMSTRRSQATLCHKPVESISEYKLKRPRVIAHLPIRW